MLSPLLRSLLLFSLILCSISLGACGAATPSIPATQKTEQASSTVSTQTVTSAASSVGTEITDSSREPIAFSVVGLDLHIVKEEGVGVPEELHSIMNDAKACNPKPVGYYGALREKFEGAHTILYSLRLRSASSATPYKILLVPNLPGYHTLAALREDFSPCGVGGLYPFTVNTKWLVFSTSCGNSEDCGSIKDVVEPTISIR